MSRGMYYESAEIHLKKYLPKIYGHLKEVGDLEEYLEYTQDNAGNLLLQLMDGGLNYVQAQEFISEHLYLLQEPEKLAEARNRAESYRSPALPVVPVRLEWPEAPEEFMEMAGKVSKRAETFDLFAEEDLVPSG